ncbi:MAG: HEAT repeat domain-containing protein [Anaerohalosphaera sp.]|nr:HEAT repeat domain-containing protein [Anaerohalosphaera sp.]
MKIFRIVILVVIAASILGCNEQNSGSTRPAPLNTQSIQQLKPQALNILQQALSNEQGAIRSIAIEITASTNQRQLMATVMSLLKDEYIAIRFAAAVAIGDTNYKPAESALKNLLRENNRNARIAAAYALTKLGNYQYRSVVIDAINSTDQTVRANAALLIGKLGDKGDLKLLYAAINDIKSEDKVRLQAVESIAMLGDERIYKKIWALFISKFADDRVIGIRAMGMINTPEAHNSIITMLNDEVPWVRITAAEQLAKRGDNIAKPDLMDHLKHLPRSLSDNNIDNADILAASAIGQFNEPDLTAFLPDILDSRSTIMQLNAAWSVLTLAK